MAGIFYGRELFLHICKLKRFKSKQIRVDGNVFLCSQGPYRAVNSDRETSEHYFVYRRNFNCLFNCFIYRYSLCYILGEGVAGVLTL